MTMEDTTRIALALTAAFALIAGYFTWKELKEWEAFAEANHCQVIAFEKGAYYHLPDGKGGTTLERHQDRTTYRCDGGLTVVR